MLGEYGLTWPWESLHVEALASYDHRLKGRNTGILDGPRIRYVVPGKDGWNTSDAWPPKGSGLRELALRADGTPRGRGGPAGRAGVRFVGHGTAPARAQADDRADPPALPSERRLTPTSNLVGDGELILLAAATAADAHRVDRRRLQASARTIRPSTSPSAGYAPGYAPRQSSSPAARSRSCGRTRAGTNRRGGRLPDSVGGQRTTIHSRSPGPAGIRPATTSPRTCQPSWASGTRPSGRRTPSHRQDQQVPPSGAYNRVPTIVPNRPPRTCLRASRPPSRPR